MAVDLINNGVIVTTAMAVHSGNIDEIDEVAATVKSWGVYIHRISGLMSLGNAKDITFVDTLELMEKIKNASNNFSDERFHITKIEENIEVVKNKIALNCGCGSLILSIDPSLNVFPCVMIRDEKGLFNLGEISLKEGLENIKDSYYNVVAPSQEKCGNCDRLVLCNGCIAEALIQSKINKGCIWK